MGLDRGPQLPGQLLGPIEGALDGIELAEVFEHLVDERADHRGLARRVGQTLDVLEVPAARATVEGARRRRRQVCRDLDHATHGAGSV